MILICYDGSRDAKAAIESAGKIFAGEKATVLTVWVPFIEVMERTGSGFAYSPAIVDMEQIDAASEQNARARADEGVELARSAGLDAESGVRAQSPSVADAVIAEASETGASAIVIGTRGLTGLKSIVLGSVSHAVLHRAELPVVVVPSPKQ